MTQIRPVSRLNVACSAIAVFIVLAFGLATESRASELIIRGPDGAEVLINGVTAGLLPFDAPLDLEPGLHVIQCDLCGYEPYEQVLEVGDQRALLQIHVRLQPYRLRTALASNLLIAGAGQRYLGRNRSGWLYTVAEVGGLLTATWGELTFRNHKSDYQVAFATYHADVSALDAEEHRLEAEDAWDKMESAENLRRTGFITAGAAIAISLLDAWLRFPSFESGPGTVPADVQADLFQVEPAGAHAGIHAGWRMSFQF